MEDGKKIFFSVFVFCSLVAASPSNVGIKMLMGMELRYLLTFQMSYSSASLTNFCHVLRLHLFISRLNIHRCSFHISSSSCLPYLLNLRRLRSACFRSFSRFLIPSSFAELTYIRSRCDLLNCSLYGCTYIIR